MTGAAVQIHLKEKTFEETLSDSKDQLLLQQAEWRNAVAHLERSVKELELAQAEAGEIDEDFQVAIEENAAVIERKTKELDILAAKLLELDGKQAGCASAAEVRAADATAHLDSRPSAGPSLVGMVDEEEDE